MDLKKVNNNYAQSQQISNQQTEKQKQINNEKANETSQSSKKAENQSQNNVNQDYIQMLNSNGVGNNIDKTV